MYSRKPEVILVALLLLFIVPLGFLLKEGAALTLAYITFALLVADKSIRQNWRLLFITFLSLLAHQIASIINIYYTVLIGADMDAVGFHEIAKTMAYSIQPGWYAEFGNMDVGSNVYTRFLAFFYRLFGDSKLLGQELSITAFIITCIIFIKLSHRLGLEKWQIGLMFLFGLPPSIIIFTSITMREALQMLFFLLTIYLTFLLRRKRSLLKMVFIVLAGIGFGTLHNGLVIYALFLVSMSFFWGLGFKLREWSGRSLVAKMIGIALIVGVIMAWAILASDVGTATRALMSGEGSVYVGEYREKVGENERASYGGKLDTSSISAFLPSSIWVFILYMFAPFPWQFTAPVDVYAALEGVLRLLLLYQALTTWWRARGERRSQWGYLILCFLSLEFLWALGTANWGTAIRHHLVAYSLLVVTGGPGLLRAMTRLLPRRRRGYVRPRRLRLVRAEISTQNHLAQ